jgi:hypothetical protein
MRMTYSAPTGDANHRRRCLELWVRKTYAKLILGLGDTPHQMIDNGFSGR